MFAFAAPQQPPQPTYAPIPVPYQEREVHHKPPKQKNAPRKPPAPESPPAFTELQRDASPDTAQGQQRNSGQRPRAPRVKKQTEEIRAAVFDLSPSGYNADDMDGGDIGVEVPAAASKALQVLTLPPSLVVHPWVAATPLDSTRNNFTSDDEWVVAHIFLKNRYKYVVKEVARHPHFAGTLSYSRWNNYYSSNKERLLRLTQLYNFWRDFGREPTQEDLDESPIFATKLRQRKRTEARPRSRHHSEGEGDDQEVEETPALDVEDELAAAVELGYVVAPQRAKRRSAQRRVPVAQLLDTNTDAATDENEWQPAHAASNRFHSNRGVESGLVPVGPFYYFNRLPRQQISPSSKQRQINFDKLAQTADLGASAAPEAVLPEPVKSEQHGPDLPIAEFVKYHLLEEGTLIYNSRRKRIGANGRSSNSANFLTILSHVATITSGARILSDGILYGSFREFSRPSGGPTASGYHSLRVGSTPIVDLGELCTAMKEAKSKVILNRNVRQALARRTRLEGLNKEAWAYLTQPWFEDRYVTNPSEVKEYAEIDLGGMGEVPISSKNRRKRKSASPTKSTVRHVTGGKGGNEARKKRKILPNSPGDASAASTKIPAPSKSPQEIQQELDLAEIERDIAENAVEVDQLAPLMHAQLSRPIKPIARRNFDGDHGGDTFLDDAFANIPMFPVEALASSTPAQALSSLLV